MIDMQIDLASVGMEKGKQYETIITTTSCDDIKNAADRKSTRLNSSHRL